ncbi:S8 family peptidase [Chryseobacterium sp. T1]
MKKYPFYYYLFLLLALIVSILFWFFLFAKNYNNKLASVENRIIDPSVYVLRPIENPQIIDDSDSGRKLLSNYVNVAIKDTTNRTKSFIDDFSREYNANYQIVYADSTINYIQIKLPADVRISFKNDVKKRLQNYDLLVWDESIFKTGYTISNNSEWFLDAANLSNIEGRNQASNVKIAILDNGFDLEHPAIKGRIANPYNVTENSQNVAPSDANHGTHIASLAAGYDKTTNYEGVCTTCNIIPVKIEDSSGLITSTYIIKGILYAIKNKADVVNMSFGAAFFNEGIPLDIQNQFIISGAKDEEDFWKELFNYAERNKTICVIAAGNSNMLTGFDPFQRAENTIKVGAYNQNYEKAEFSNFGKLTSIYAPGTHILGAKPNNSYEYLDGTSMAAPIISGFVATLKAKNKNIGYKEVINMINKNSENKNNINILKFN